MKLCYRQTLLFTLVLAPVVAIAFLGSSASAQVHRLDELVDKALALEPDTIAGRELYRKHCRSCHGRKAYGDSRTATPALAGQVASYVVKQLADLAEGYRELPEMHRQIARTELGNPQAMRDLSAYLNTLSPLTESQRGDGKQLALGARIYKSVCAECHGAGGEGDADHRVPALRGQHYSYVLRQTRQLASGHRYSVEVPVIVLLDALSLEQLTAVADFISRLPVSTDVESSVADVRQVGR